MRIANDRSDYVLITGGLGPTSDDLTREAASLYFDEELILNKKGDTVININYSNDLETYKFKLKNLRNIDRKSINLLRNRQLNLYIHQ